MDKKAVGLSGSFKGNTAPKSFSKNPIKGTKFTIAISSAKGGVGKSTFAMNFALALKAVGQKVGILDADIYGPSLPKMMSINEKPKSEDGKSLVPINQYGVQCMSIGFLVDEETPMIWRGPMVTSAIKTFTQKTEKSMLTIFSSPVNIKLSSGTSPTPEVLPESLADLNPISILFTFVTFGVRTVSIG